MLFMIRSGVQILSDHPRLYWTRHSTPGRDWFRIQKPVPADPLWTAKQDSISLPGQVGLPRKADRVLLGGPQRIGRHRFLDPEPVPARGGVPGPVQAGMVGQDLYPGADHEQHEEQVEDCLLYTSDAADE